jgi:abhydrolase domain-containing protein 17
MCANALSACSWARGTRGSESGGAIDVKPRRSPLKPWMKLLLFLASVYAGLAVMARFLAGKALYYPDLASRQAPASVDLVRDEDGNEIAVTHLANPGARFTIWFFHGNAEALGDLHPTMAMLRAAGFAVFAFDYPGYGVSTGKPSEKGLYASARAARQYLREKLNVPPERTIIYGRSLGGGPAVQMAAEERVGGLVLQSAFVSVFRVLTRVKIFPGDMFDNEAKLARIAAPVLVMHGRADEVIPFRHGEQLLAVAREPKRSLFVEGAHHNDFVGAAGPRYADALREFSELCARDATPPR